MGEIIAFLVYVLSGVYLANVVIGNSSHKMDEFEKLIAIVVLITFWPIALVALMVIILDNWFNRGVSMDNLIKAMRCCTQDCEGLCSTCEYNQPEYALCEAPTLMPLAIQKIIDLQKSNRNWRRKAQRLRKEIKELKEDK